VVILGDIGRAGGIRSLSPHDGGSYFAPIWIDERAVGAVRLAHGRYEAVRLDLERSGVDTLARLPGDDLDWSPDRTRIVCARSRAGDDGRGLQIVRLPRLRQARNPEARPNQDQ
jgi:hypothetical protein